MCDIYERRWRNVVARKRNDSILGPCFEFRAVNMDTQTKCVAHQVFFLDVNDLDAAEIQRICSILGVPEPEMPALSGADEGSLPVHSTLEHDKTPESSANTWVSEADAVPPSVLPSELTTISYGAEAEAINCSPHHTEAAQQFADVMSSTGPSLFMPEHNLTIPPPMQTLVQLGMHPVVVTNPLGVSAVTSVCMVSVPAGIPALPGIPVHGLPPSFLPHPATFHGDPADLNFFQNHPPPNMSRMNPHVQEFVPGRDYIMREENCQTMSAFHPHQQMVPQHLPPPVAFMAPSYAKLTGASHGIPAFPSDGHPGGPHVFLVDPDAVQPPVATGGFDPSVMRSTVEEPLLGEHFQEVQGIYPHLNNSAVFTPQPQTTATTALSLQEQTSCRTLPEDASLLAAAGGSMVAVDCVSGSFEDSSSHRQSDFVLHPAAGTVMSNSIPVKQNNTSSLSAAINMPCETMSTSTATVLLTNSSSQQIQPQEAEVDRSNWPHPLASRDVDDATAGPVQSLASSGQACMFPENTCTHINCTDAGVTTTADQLKGSSQAAIVKNENPVVASQCGSPSTANQQPMSNKGGTPSVIKPTHKQSCNSVSLETAPLSATLSASETGFPVLNTNQSKPASLVNGVSATSHVGATPSADVMEETSKQKSQSGTPVAAGPPKMSWANLFKGSSPSTAQPVATYKEEAEKPAAIAAQPVPPQPAAGASPTSEVVSVDNDSMAAKLGEFLSTVELIHTSVALQPRGLVNKANWCYVNATLQALVACPPFYHLFKNLAELPLLSRSASSTPLLDSLIQFTSEFHKQERQDRGNVRRGKYVELVPGPVFEPEYVYKMLQHTKVSSSFKHGLQEDAEEFLSCVLDGVHEEMLAAIKHATGGENGTSQTNGYLVASNPCDNNGDTIDDTSFIDEDEWQEVGRRNRGVHTRKTSLIAKTPIAKIFSGLIRSGIMQASSKERATLQPFFTLQLDIQGDRVTSVKEALEHFVSKESIQGFTCSKTGEEVEVVKRTTLEELPPVLILHLKCFVYDQTGGCQKLLKNIKFDVDLNITKDLLSPTAKAKLQQAQRTYKLFAVVFHHGKKATGGHYTTDVFHPGINSWVHMDDSRILSVQESDVLNYLPPKMPYLLYYRQRDLTTPS